MYNTLRVVKAVDFGLYLDGEPDEILLPKRYVPEGLESGDTVKVFIYHDNEGRLIATTAHPVAAVGDFALMEVADVNRTGAFLKWGIMKDVFLPLSLQKGPVDKGDWLLVRLFIDERTGRVTASEKVETFLSNRELTIKEKDTVDLIIYRKTEIGYNVIINNQHMGLLHANEVFRPLEFGEKTTGFIKKIREDLKIDVVLGAVGYTRVQDEGTKIMDLLVANSGYLPFNDKSDPESIYEQFGMSKKTFKMTLGALYKQRKIEFTTTGIKKVD